MPPLTLRPRFTGRGSASWQPPSTTSASSPPAPAPTPTPEASASAEPIQLGAAMVIDEEAPHVQLALLGQLGGETGGETIRLEGAAGSEGEAEGSALEARVARTARDIREIEEYEHTHAKIQHVHVGEHLPEIGRLLDGIEGESDRPLLVFFLGDNGTPGSIVRAPFDASRAKDTLYQGGIRVPFCVRGPEVPSASTTDALVHVVDIFATVLELLERKVPDTWDGESFAKALQDGSDLGRDFLVVSQAAWACQRGVRFGD